MIGLREDQRERGELVAMIRALLPDPWSGHTSPSTMRLEYLREPARPYKGGTTQAGGWVANIEGR